LLAGAAALTDRFRKTLWIRDEIVNDFGTNSGSERVALCAVLTR